MKLLAFKTFWKPRSDETFLAQRIETLFDFASGISGSLSFCLQSHFFSKTETMPLEHAAI